MLATITKTLLCLALCFCMSCAVCVRNQDIASVELVGSSFSNADIDSVAMITNDSIIGAIRYGREIVGSETHCVKFPINVHILLFRQGDLWKEFFLQMDKNTVLKVYGSGCKSLESAKKSDRFIDSSVSDDYCWLLEKMDDSYEDDRCVEVSPRADPPVDVTKCPI